MGGGETPAPSVLAPAALQLIVNGTGGAFLPFRDTPIPDGLEYVNICYNASDAIRLLGEDAGTDLQNFWSGNVQRDTGVEFEEVYDDAGYLILSLLYLDEGSDVWIEVAEDLPFLHFNLKMQ